MTNTGVQINARALVRFLQMAGFGQFQLVDGRTATTELFKNEDGVLQIHNASSLRRWLIEFVEKTSSMENSDGITTEISEGVRFGVSDKLVKITPSTLDNYCKSLPIWSESGLHGTKKLPMFRDDQENCYIPFKNGVVHITAQKIEMLGSDILEGKGCIWESKILQHNMEVQDTYIATQPSPFRDFVHYALKIDVKPKTSDNDRDEGTDDGRYKAQKDAFETGFGYLVHAYQPPDESKVVVFIDVDSSPERTEGGNGKSLSMDMVQYFRETAFVDGKSFRKALSDSARFNFSNVKVDTGFVYINDLNPDFDLTQLFSIITDDMTIEGKGTNKFVIPRDRKPKMGITTNYVITGIGGSFERRQHIVEFGNFWNQCNQLKIKPQSIIGKLLGKMGFNTEDDWISFYNYGFHCVQKYLQNGLMAVENASYQKKTIIASIEGDKGTGDVVEWIEEYITNDRKSHKDDGVEINEFYQSFIKEMMPTIVQEWDVNRFLSGVFNYVKYDVDLEWNPHLSSKGSTRSNRRWRKGSRGDQKEFVRITHTDD